MQNAPQKDGARVQQLLVDHFAKVFKVNISLAAYCQLGVQVASLPRSLHCPGHSRFRPS